MSLDFVVMYMMRKFKIIMYYYLSLVHYMVFLIYAVQFLYLILNYCLLTIWRVAPLNVLRGHYLMDLLET
jgi:hypothetical protein